MPNDRIMSLIRDQAESTACPVVDYSDHDDDCWDDWDDWDDTEPR